MLPLACDELVLIRHAPADSEGRICGRRDVAARLGDPAAIDTLARRLAPCALVVGSPALRCRQTARALFPGREVPTDARLWEQDFGAHEGMPAQELPDLGPLDRASLAALSAPGGESFAAMAARVTPALADLAARARGGGPVAVVAHAGTVRAGLALALGDIPAALAFEVAPLSLTRLRCLPDGFSVICANAV
ncbi:bifunctional RNase H/acid phosphatase [Paracoccus haematequi]|uniref:Bifunctional RNase H/acid phosphatase n=1 Tax=Paracoccus haematequi TaxID=2491866 RepID=A0A3S4DBF4_9RHOB|nr:histidine phosphatase family protein [Paracoccus haematequi]VDS08688.1 bifunctional RNase H/acid phosphatase [Paracoccus haematequi]